MLDRIRDYINTKILSEQGFIKSVQDCDKLNASVFYLYHDSFESYVNNRTITLKRKLHYISVWLFSGYIFIHFLIAIIHPDPSLLRIMGSPVILITGHYNVLNAIFLFAATFKLCSLVTMLYMESRRVLYLVDLSYSWTVSPDLFGLNQTNTRKLIFRTQLGWWPLSIYVRIVQLVMCSGVTLCGLIAYFKHDYPFISLVLHLTAINLFIIHIADELLISFFALFVPITYLNFKFDETNQLIKTQTLWNNRSGIMAAVEQHYNTVRLTNQLAIFYNIILGFVYIIYPYIIGLLIEILFVPDFHYLAKIVIILLGLSFTSCVYITNHILASITIHNDLILKFLLRTHCTNKKLKLDVKLKLENLMVRLIYEFIGFYAMNWFKFTKRAFYEFILTVSSAYILVKSMLK